jgi:hypothetical protein
LGTAVDVAQNYGGIVILARTSLKDSGFVFPHIYIVCFLESVNIFIFKSASTYLSALRKYLHTRFDPRGSQRAVELMMMNFSHKFIPNLAHKAAPLNAPMRKGVKFKWGEEQHAAFGELKVGIMNPPVLAMADFRNRFILQTDASSSAVGAVLLQEVRGQRRPTVFASRMLSTQETKFSVYEFVSRRAFRCVKV